MNSGFWKTTSTSAWQMAHVCGAGHVHAAGLVPALHPHGAFSALFRAWRRRLAAAVRDMRGYRYRVPVPPCRYSVPEIRGLLGFAALGFKAVSVAGHRRVAVKMGCNDSADTCL